MADVGDDRATDASVIVSSQGEPERFTVIFDRHAPTVHRYLWARVGRDDAEDLVAETFVIAFRTRHRYDPDRPSARPWLLGIATNVARHHRRAEGRRRIRLRLLPAGRDHHDVADDVATAVDGDTEAARVGAALGRLDEAQRDVLLLVAGTELSYEEAAQALGVPVGTVRSRLARGRARMRELLEAGGQYHRDGAPSSAAATDKTRP